MKKSQSGFAVLETILILVVIGIIGFTGWYVWHSRQATDKTFNQTGNSEVVKGALSDTTQKNNQSSQQKYLVIKEWGVELPLTSDYYDATYCFQPAHHYAEYSAPDGPYVYLSSKSLGGQTSVDKNGQCDGLLAIARYKIGDTIIYGGGETEIFDRDKAKDAPKVGDYYYTIEGPHTAYSEDSSTQAKASALAGYFMSVFNKLQSVE